MGLVAGLVWGYEIDRVNPISCSEEIKKDCAVIPIIVAAEVKKWLKCKKSDEERLTPVRTILGNSNVISLHTPNPRYRRNQSGVSHKEECVSLRHHAIKLPIVVPVRKCHKPIASIGG